MRILILHRISDKLVRYADGIDHMAHDVTYVGTADRLAMLPSGLRCTLIERPGTGDTAAEVLAAVAGLSPFDLVIALSEFDLIAGAQVRAALDVPGDREADILPSRDKVVMKSAVAAAGLRVPRFLSLTEALDAESCELPWAGETVLKPLDGAASQDVHVYPTPAAALDTIRDRGVPEGTERAGFEIEEFVTGPIIHVDGLLIDGKAVAIQASRYVGTCLGYVDGTPLGSVQIELTPELSQWTMDCLAAVGITTSLFHLEGIETAEGLVFLEVGARFGGADVVDTFELATGLHLPSRFLQMITGGTDAGVELRPDDAGSRYGWFVWPGHQLGGEFCRIDGERVFRESSLAHRWIQRSKSEPIKTQLSYSDADVPLAGIVGPADSAELDRFLRDVFSFVRVELADSKELSHAQPTH
ncbi:acetyl-CoA carboxylase biotin carboxylase subunit family protein [Streptomyces sp. NBC_01408]|uniref:ATP-grasp domain-containing protein n=1 Tax=Streptomyces sp. NBC_01408 TaxID=2903855 RepID=UPI0022593FE8|nr:ATP-grasp domain-containing protein [Streptomyces sp. NBC_01408]MCX4692533.1 ATP-grasp domain-containing protein [Streptomyces sp. NBC_01408]